MTETQIAELDALEHEGGADDVDRMLDLMTEVGADAEQLDALVEKYGTSWNEHIRAMLALVLNRAAWVWNFEDERLLPVVLRFANAVSGAPTDGPLITTLNALFGLASREILLPRDDNDRAVLGGLLLMCVSRDNWDVRSTALYVLTRMHSDGILHGLLTDRDSTALKDALRTMTVDPEDLEYWEALRTYWAAA